MVTVYEHPLSPYAQKIKIALYEKSVPFESVMPDLFGGATADFVRSNPRREVPSLVDGDVAVFDSTIILEYIEDKWPAPPMLPATPADRARVRMLEELCDTYYEAINWGLAEIRFFGRARGELAEQMTARAGEQIAGMHRKLERELGGRPWFNGDSFGWGDLSVYPHVFNSAGQGFAPPAGSAVADWMARAGARESTQRCAQAAMEALAGFSDLSPLVEQGAVVREYRDHRLEWMLRSGGEGIVRDGVAKKNIRFSVEIS